MIKPGDAVIPSNRTRPITVDSIRMIDEYEGSIKVRWECRCTGPQGAEIRIQRTGTGRLRMSTSKYGPFENIESITYHG